MHSFSVEESTKCFGVRFSGVGTKLLVSETMKFWEFFQTSIEVIKNLKNSRENFRKNSNFSEKSFNFARGVGMTRIIIYGEAIMGVRGCPPKPEKFQAFTHKTQL